MDAAAARDLADLAQAKRLLERTSLAMRLANCAGRPVEILLERLPASVSAGVAKATQAALLRMMDTVAQPTAGLVRPQRGLHKLAAVGAGAAGGLFGLPGLAAELPVSTGLMLSAIARIAETHGEDLRLPATRLECLTVFALGGPGGNDDAVESGYFAVRLALAKVVAEAAEYLAGRGAAGIGAPVLVRLATAVAQRFGLAVSEKFALQALPVVGAACGAGLNYAFIGHFQDKAQGHFIIRRLERSLGPARVRELYDGL